MQRIISFLLFLGGPLLGIGQTSRTVNSASPALQTSASLVGPVQTALYNSGATLQLQSGATLYIAGNTTINSGSLTNNGSLRTTGNFANNGTMNAPAGSNFYLQGSSSQTLSGAQPIVVNNVQINNSAGITVNAKLQVDGQLTFSTGVVTASSSLAPVVLTVNGSVNGTPTDGSHINGYVLKQGTGSFTFPTGSAFKYQPISVNLSNNGGGLFAIYNAGDAGAAAFNSSGTETLPLTGYNTGEYWSLSPVSSATGTVTLKWDSYNDSYSSPLSERRLANKVAGQWRNEGGLAVGTTTIGSITGNAISSWGLFALGSRSCTPTSSDTSATSCNSLMWHGKNYTASGDYNDTTINAAGCDSVIRLHLTIKTRVVIDTSITRCYSITFRDSTYKASGLYTYYTGNNPCDTAFNLNLTVTSIPSTFSKTDATCNLPSNGSLEVTATSGVPPFEYKLGTAGTYGNANQFDSLRGGRYYVYIKDATGCLGLAGPIVITEPAPFPVSLAATPTSCFAGSDGTIEVTVPGSLSKSSITASNLYSIGTTGNYQSSNVFTSLRALTYRITVKNPEGCLSTSTIAVGEPTKVVLSATGSNSTCIKNPDGRIKATATGGSGSYMYKLGTAAAYVSNNLFTGVRASANPYRVYAKDSKGCLATPVPVTITQESNTCVPVPTFARSLNDREEMKNGFDVVVSPNPSVNVFKLNVIGDAAHPVTIRVLDLNGKTVYTTKGGASQVFNFGETLLPGLYLIEVRQADAVKMVKAFKIK